MSVSPAPLTGQIKPGHCVAAICEAFGVTLREIRSDRRTAPIFKARAAAAYLAREMTGAGFGLIGRALGDSDHVRAIHAARRAEELLEEDNDFADRMAAARSVINVMERAGLAHLLAQVDPVESARRIVAEPGRAAMLATDLEIQAMAELIVRTFGWDDQPEPTTPETQTETENQ